MINLDTWEPPILPEQIPGGDMPGDRITVVPELIAKANKIFPELIRQVNARKAEERVVVSVCGGSGVGKSTIASILAYYLGQAGIGCYTLSGDNYPHRIPKHNDAERLRVFQSGGVQALAEYLGSPQELDFSQLNQIITVFKAGADHLSLKRMGREETEIWYDRVDFRNIQVLLIEWTHGNSKYLNGVDIPILLSSTPQETLAHRLARNRDSNADSPFTTMVLEIEQKQILAQTHRAKIILTNSGELLLPVRNDNMDNRPMLNAYPDSMGGTLEDITEILGLPQLQGAFGSMYILPSLYYTDLDRGFSVIDYDLNGVIAKREDLDTLREMGIDLKLDFILNHLSVRSEAFQDILKNGDASQYKDFFINWNAFWEGCGEMNTEGYIQPKQELIRDMFFRKPGLPILMVEFPDGKQVPYWNTFYQKVTEENGQRHYLGQMDLNIQSPLVWEHYEETLEKLSGYGAKIVRLDAFAYAPKSPGKRNFLNDPETWELLEKVRQIADRFGLTLLPEIHAAYGEKIYEQIASRGYMTYDFFLPGLIIDALESGCGERLAVWARELVDKKIHTVNMLGCHDGIPMLDLKGLLPDERIDELIALLVSRGGHVKELHGQKNMYYQVNATYLSALGENEKKLLLARAIQLFMPGKPQIWYLDLLAGTNDYEAMRRAGKDGHKEINRTNLAKDEVMERLKLPVVQKQLELLRFRCSSPAFAMDSQIEAYEEGTSLSVAWTHGNDKAWLRADLATYEFQYGT